MEYKGLIAGLGNPGSKYEGTRHNCGFDFVTDLLDVARNTGDVEQLAGSKFSCELWRVRLPQLHGCWLVTRPQTFMNLSGLSIQPLLAWYKLRPDNLLVVHDELDIPPGELRFKKGGGNAGHNGLKSINEQLGTPNFYRLRIGIGRPQYKDDIIHWVLGHPDTITAKKLSEARSQALEVLFIFADQGLEKAVHAAKHLNKDQTT
ncbi:MAG: aminoacyl-tRNA hydrolase [Desulfovibrio sp.]|nr:aminoacyl-tRNA hydrolase [Desulfovibrio sp.]